MKIIKFLLTLALLVLGSPTSWALDNLLQTGPSAIQRIQSAKKIYFVLASSLGTGRSMAGHAYLRLGLQDKPGDSDLMIEFLADADDANMNYLRALGLWGHYDRKVVVEKYSTVKYSMNLIANRDLTSFELKLSDSQRSQLLELISKYVSAGKMGEYSFTGSNCAQAVTSLFAGLGIDFSWPTNIVPYMIPQALREKNLVKDVYRDESLLRQRLLLALQYQPLIDKYLPNHIDQFKSLEFSDRASAFVLLKKATEQAPLADKNKLKTYLYQAIFLENKFVRDELLSYVNGKKEFLISKPFNTTVLVSEQAAFLQTRFRLSHANLRYKNKQLQMVYEFKTIDQNLEAPKKIIRTITEQEMKVANFDILIDEVIVGHIVSDDFSDSNIIFTNGWHHEEALSYTQEGRLIVTTMFFSEPDPKVTEKNLNYFQESNLKNNNPLRPMCYALVDFEKRLLEQIIWQPEEKKLSERENLELVSKLMQRDIVIIPGYSSPREWTQSLNQDDLSKILYNFQQTKYSGIASAIGIFFKQILMTPEDLNFIIKKAARGIYTPVFFRTPSGYGHAILITGVTAINDSVVTLKAYDPNIQSAPDLAVSGFTKDVFTVNLKNNKISSYTYGTSELYTVALDTPSELMTSSLVSDPSSRRILSAFSKSSGRHSISLTEASMAY